MHISELELLNFRNYPKLHVIFTTGLNVIVGNNGVGKTNVVEAIDLFGFGRSFRTSEAKNLIRYGEEKAFVTAIVHTTTRLEISLEITAKGKKITVNGKTLPKLSALSRYVNCTTFQPEDVLFFDDTPGRRRKYLDTNLVRRDELYLAAITRYEKLLKERNALLKKEESGELLSLINEPFLKEAATISEKRDKFIKELNKNVNEILQQLSPDKMVVRFTYESSLGSKENILKNGLETLKKNEVREKIMQTTLSGPHRDDIGATLNGKKIKESASQGQKRLIVIALTLAPYFIEKESYKKPIVILDDVLSELDSYHQGKLIELLLKCNQAFITTTNYDNYAHAIYSVDETKQMRRITL